MLGDMGRKREPHPNSIAANLHKLTEEQREKYDRNRKQAMEDYAAMEGWAQHVTGKGKPRSLSQDPVANDGTSSRNRKAIPSGDRTDQRSAE